LKVKITLKVEENRGEGMKEAGKNKRGPPKGPKLLVYPLLETTNFGLIL